MHLKKISDVEWKNHSKASNLSRLEKLGFKIPNTYCLLMQNKGPSKIENLEILDANKTYAVRSSMSDEDGHTSSKAGMYESYLKVAVDEISDAVKKVHKSYQISNTLMTEETVIIQEMVNPEYAGVIFTRNPISGLHETILEMVDGLGSDLVQDGVEPSRIKYKWGKLLSDDKELVDKEGSWIKKLCKTALKIDGSLEYDVDLEWAYDGKDIYWLQLRPITTESRINIYDNTIAKNYLPGLIKPLVYDVNVPLVNGAWVTILEEILGPIGVKAEELARSFYYRAYFNMGVLGQVFRQIGFREDFLEKLQGINDERLEVKFRPTLKMLKNGGKAFRFIKKSRRDIRDLGSILDAYHQRSLQLEASIEACKSEDDFLNMLADLQDHNKEGAYYKILIPLIHTAGQRKLNKLVQEENLHLGVSYHYEALKDYEPAIYLEGMTLPLSDNEIKVFLDKFGHFSDNNNDFSNPVWREEHDFLMSLSPSKPDLSIPDLPKKVLKLKKKADEGNRQLSQLTYYYNYSYQLFRQLFLCWGAYLESEGILEDRHDIFYLRLSQLLSKAEANKAIKFKEQISFVKDEFEEFKDSVLPTKIYGTDKPILIESTKDKIVYEGVPMSNGRLEGTVRVVNSLQDYGKVEDGDILILPHSDMSFESLLAKASAVLIESGGILSHIGILARERQIPAITSVNNITRMKDGCKVAIDAYIGKVYVMKE